MSSMLINTRALPLRKSVVTAPFRLYPERVKKNYATELWHAGGKSQVCGSGLNFQVKGRPREGISGIAI